MMDTAQAALRRIVGGVACRLHLHAWRTAQAVAASRRRREIVRVAVCTRCGEISGISS